MNDTLFDHKKSVNIQKTCFKFLITLKLPPHPAS